MRDGRTLHDTSALRDSAVPGYTDRGPDLLTQLREMHRAGIITTEELQGILRGMPRQLRRPRPATSVHSGARPDAAWLFVRGQDTVRIVRVAELSGQLRLLVNGPGTRLVTHVCMDHDDCARLQALIAGELHAEDYTELVGTTERRARER